MTQPELIAFAEQFFGGSIELMKKKNNDYGNPKAHKTAFGNLSAVETFGIPAEVGFITRMTDKLSRIATFVHAGELQVKDESVTDTLRDLANYSMLMAAYISSQKSEDTIAIRVSGKQPDIGIGEQSVVIGKEPLEKEFISAEAAQIKRIVDWIKEYNLKVVYVSQGPYGLHPGSGVIIISNRSLSKIEADVWVEVEHKKKQEKITTESDGLVEALKKENIAIENV